MVERRDQVRITRRSRERVSSRHLRPQGHAPPLPPPTSPIKTTLHPPPFSPPPPTPRAPPGPTDSGPDPFTPPLLAPLHDQAVAGLALARLRPQSGLAPRTHRSR